MDCWFRRSRIGRSLTEGEQQFVGALTRLLEEVRPGQIKPSDTSLTAEGRDLIALLPHQALGGVSIVVSFVGASAQIQWSQIWDLSHYHDDLDSGVVVERFGHLWRPTPPELIVEAVRRQLDAPIFLRCIDSTRVSVAVRDQRDVIRECGELTIVTDEALSTRILAFGRAEVRMTDQQPPPVEVPSNAENWFG